MYLPPAFFDIMVYLIVHLVRENNIVPDDIDHPTTVFEASPGYVGYYHIQGV